MPTAIAEHPAAQPVSDSTPDNDFLWFACPDEEATLSRRR
jgi:hypothetical protein